MKIIVWTEDGDDAELVRQIAQDIPRETSSAGGVPVEVWSVPARQLADRSDDRPVFSFRAECQDDVEIFFDECQRAGIEATDVHTRVEMPFPDVQAEFRASPETTVDQVLQVAKTADENCGDLHVVVETMRPVPLAENSFERSAFVQQLGDERTSALGDRGQPGPTPSERRWIDEHLSRRSGSRDGSGLEL